MKDIILFPGVAHNKIKDKATVKWTDSLVVAISHFIVLIWAVYDVGNVLYIVLSSDICSILN